MIGETLKIGDTVIINIPDENWKWGYHPVKKQKGTEAKITGFGEIAYSRIQSFGKEPGIYTNHCWIQLEGIEGSVSSCFIELKDQEEYKKRCKNKRDDKKSIRPLPETKFWEDDIVTFTSSAHYIPWKNEKEVKIASINYDYMDQKRNDGSPMPEYNVTPINYNGGQIAVNENDLVLIRRGNVWKYFHNEKIEFKDLYEEANFFKMLGHYKEVPNPKTKLYSWTKDEVLQAIKDGIADCLSLDTGLFDTCLRHSAIRLRDRVLGEKVRKATLVGFNL